MKLSAAFLPALLFLASARAQYFSAGWTPGQPVESPKPVPEYAFDPPPREEPAPVAPTDVPPTPDALGHGGTQRPLGIVDKLMLSSPVQNLFGKFGLNMSDVVKRGSTLPWDPRIPLITDDNYEEMIVNEVMTEEEEKDRAWFLIITVTSSQNSAVSKMVDAAFDDAFNQTLEAGDLTHLRWGRIDYMSTTYLTTKWAIWTGPYMVHIMNRGQTLRFYRADRVRVTGEILRELLTEEVWRNTEPWSSNFAPGGNREFVMHYYAYALQRAFSILDRTPRFVIMIISGAVASLAMRLLHKPAPEGAAKPQPEAQQPAAIEKSATASVSGSSTAVNSAATSSPGKSKGKSRKGGKK